MNWYLKVVKEYVNFKGRARRKEYWMFVLFHIIFALIALGLDNLLGTTISLGDIASSVPDYAGPSSLPYGYIYILYTFAMLLPSISVGVRRLQDTGKSGWLMLLGLIPCVGIVLLIFFVQDSTPGDNEYGPNPKGVESLNP